MKLNYKIHRGYRYLDQKSPSNSLGTAIQGSHSARFFKDAHSKAEFQKAFGREFGSNALPNRRTALSVFGSSHYRYLDQISVPTIGIWIKKYRYLDQIISVFGSSQNGQKCSPDRHFSSRTINVIIYLITLTLTQRSYIFLPQNQNLS